MIKIDSKIPEGPVAEKWTNYKAHQKLVNPANKRRLDIDVYKRQDFINSSQLVTPFPFSKIRGFSNESDPSLLGRTFRKIKSSLALKLSAEIRPRL